MDNADIIHTMSKLRELISKLNDNLPEIKLVCTCDVNKPVSSIIITRFEDNVFSAKPQCKSRECYINSVKKYDPKCAVCENPGFRSFAFLASMFNQSRSFVCRYEIVVCSDECKAKIIKYKRLLSDKDHIIKMCSICKHTNKDTEMMVCSRCKSARYCSVDCQTKDWPKHKKVCVYLKK